MATNEQEDYEEKDFMPEKAKPVNELIEGETPWLLAVARVSDPSQKPALPGQRKRMTEFAEKANMPFAYVEFDESAFTSSTRQLFNEKVIQPLNKSRAHVTLAFDKIDRCTRDSSHDDKKALVVQVRSGKIGMEFPSDGLSLHKESPAADWFRFDIGVALAGYYSAAIRDNVKRRFEQKLADGEWPAKAPIGYKNVVTGHTSKGEPIKDIAIDHVRAPKVKKAFEMRAAGISYGMIARELRREGLLSTVKNKPIPKTQVEHFLQNPFYMGSMEWEGKEYPHKYERIIQPWLWSQIIEVNARRTKRRTKYASKPFIFRNLVTCATCGYTVSSDGPKNGGNIYLRCTQYGGQHGAKPVNEKLVIAQVLAIFESIRVPEERLPKLVEAVQREFTDEQAYYKTRLKALQVEYDQIDEDIKSMFKDRSKFKISPTLFDELVTEKTGRQADILEQMKDHSKGNEQFVISASRILEVAGKASQLFLAETTTISQKQRLIQFVVTNIRLDGEKVLFELNSPFDAISEAVNHDIWGE